MYNPVIGRWLSPDPLGRHNGPEVVYTHKAVADRMRAVLQPYVYVENNPPNQIDPSGLRPIGGLGMLFVPTFNNLVMQLGDPRYQVRTQADRQLRAILDNLGPDFACQFCAAYLNPLPDDLERRTRLRRICEYQIKRPFRITACCHAELTDFTRPIFNQLFNLGRRCGDMKLTLDIVGSSLLIQQQLERIHKTCNQCKQVEIVVTPSGNEIVKTDQPFGVSFEYVFDNVALQSQSLNDACCSEEGPVEAPVPSPDC